MSFPNPHYVDELQSDIRGVKNGWYAMEEDGNLSSGPFFSREDCVNEMNHPANRAMPFGLWRSRKQ